MKSLTILISTLLVVISSAIDWAPVDNKINSLIETGQFPGCVLGVYSNNQTIYKKAYGTLTPKWNMYSPPVTTSTKFDINYITQVVAVNSAIMIAMDNQHMDLATRVSRYVPDFQSNGKKWLNVQNILLHNAGLPATYVGNFGSTAQLLKNIDDIKQQYREDTKTQYSQLGYVVLGQFLEGLLKKSLEQIFFEVLLQADMRDTSFLPNNTGFVAPSGYVNKTTQGQSCNRIANVLGKKAGNAGLFSTVDDLGKIMKLLLNKGKMPNSVRIFTENIVKNFTTKWTGLRYKNTRALGWQTVPTSNPPCGKKFSSNSFGLADPTFSYIWADKDKNISIVFLANGQFPAGKQNYSSEQGNLSDLIMSALGF